MTTERNNQKYNIRGDVSGTGCATAIESHQEFSLHMEPIRSRVEVKFDTTTMRSSHVLLISLINRNRVSIFLREAGVKAEEAKISARWRRRGG